MNPTSADLDMMPQPPQPPEQKLRKSKKREPRWRLVYYVDKQGKVCDFNHVEEIQKERIFLIIKYVTNKGEDVTVHELHKNLRHNNRKIPKRNLQHLADKLSGLLWIDKKDEDGNYQLIAKRLISVRRGQFNKKANLPKVPPYIDEKAPYIFSPATA
jgi:hypothetical protein